MDYIVFDLEWNQSSDKALENEKIPFEIVEIGAVKLDSNFQVVESFSQLICPSVYQELNERTQKLIGLTAEELAGGVPFQAAACRFLDWCGKEGTFCTWGNMDLTELQRNMRFFGVESRLAKPLKYFDVQKLFSLAYEDRKARRSLEYAVDYLHLSKDCVFHRALEDANYTAQIFRQIDRKYLVNYSIDYYQCPRSRAEEIYAVFPTYSKYVSREFASKERAMSDREVTSTRCCLCGRPAKRKIRWFAGQGRNYYCLAWCEEHGYLKGKIRLKKAEDGRLFAVKTLKSVTGEEAGSIKERQEQLRQRRKEKRRKRLKGEDPKKRKYKERGRKE